MSRTRHRLDSDDNEPEAEWESRHPTRTLIQPPTPENWDAEEDDGLARDEDDGILDPYDFTADL